MIEPLHMPADQASGLRRLFKKQTTPVLAFVSSQRDDSRAGPHVSDRARVMMQFADDFVGSGRNVAIIDEHPAPGSIAKAYGVAGRKDFKHVLHGDYALDDVMLSPAAGLGIIPAPRAAGMEFTLADEAALAGNFALLRGRNDCVMVDCVHRTQRALSPIARLADQIIVLASVVDDGIMQSYGLIKRIAMEYGQPKIAVMVVHAADPSQARATYDKLKRVAQDHLGLPLHYHGAALMPGTGSLSSWQDRALRSGAAEGTEASGFRRAAARPGIADSVV